jgi:hypothetical protein
MIDLPLLPARRTLEQAYPSRAVGSYKIETFPRVRIFAADKHLWHFFAAARDR